LEPALILAPSFSVLPDLDWLDSLGQP
jgi:hypothetical protein